MSDSNKNLYHTEIQAKSALAFAQLSKIMAAMGDECDVDFASCYIKYTIDSYKNKIIQCSSIFHYYFLVFKTEEIRNEFYKKHYDLICDYYMLEEKYR